MGLVWAVAGSLPDMTADRRLLLVHAHPDDETINNGVTMARYVAEGAQVTLVTCTRGEEGEILLPEFASAAASVDDTLADLRIVELANAMAALGVTDHRFLGQAQGLLFRDSGMMGTEPNNRPDVFWQANLDAMSDLLVPVIRELRPQVVVTYDEQGGYGHPDHIQAHRVAVRAVELAGDPGHRPDLGAFWQVARIYYCAIPESNIRSTLRALRDSGDTTAFEGMDPDGPMPSFVVADELIAAAVDGRAFLEQKIAAMRAHATQIAVDGGFFALSNNLGSEVFGTEFYRLAPASVVPNVGCVDDLFAGLLDDLVDLPLKG